MLEAAHLGQEFRRGRTFEIDVYGLHPKIAQRPQIVEQLRVAAGKQAPVAVTADGLHACAIALYPLGWCHRVFRTPGIQRQLTEFDDAGGV